MTVFTSPYADSFADNQDGDFGQQQTASPLSDGRWLLQNSLLATELGVGPDWFTKPESLACMMGQQSLRGMRPFAQKYAGHQFGQYNPELGDGRGLLLGEASSDPSQREWHLKGAGRTPYSRFGDGRAVLRSSLREFLASEALHHLGIPSSRALAVAASSTTAQREQLEPCASLMRIAPSHLRFGHFEHFFYRGRFAAQRQLLDYTLRRYFPEALASAQPELALLEQIIKNTAQLVSLWQAYGFAHGVLNTDNMSIHGITFDFGPYGFIEQYQPNWICNHSDHSGRYAFDEQPSVVLWNLNALAHSFSHWLSREQIEQALAQYQSHLLQHHLPLMAKKLGLQEYRVSDRRLIGQWLALLQQNQLDYSISFRQLAQFSTTGDNALLRDQCLDVAAFDQFADVYRTRLLDQPLTDSERAQFMNAVNPKYILRNYLAQQAIEAAEQGDSSIAQQLYQCLQQPYTEQPEYQRFAEPAPEWAKSLSVSCSS